MKKTLIITLLSCLVLSCSGPRNDYYVCAYVWPSCHDDSLARHWLWPDREGEWEVIRKGDPRFEGHYQPRRPLWGYEMDDNPAVVEKWINTALKYGVNTFIYDWYWYNAPDGYHGPYLEDALDKGFLKAPSNRKMNFYIMYANHDVKYSYWNYHKWGADADSLLFNPRVGMEDWKKIVRRVITQYFSLPNYVKIDGCPVFAMFNADIFKQGFSSPEEAAEAMEYFRSEVRKAGFPGLHLQLTPGGGSDPSAAKQQHMNENIELLGINSIAFYNMGGFDCDYEKHCENAVRMRNNTDAAYDIPLFPTVSIGWDDSPRFPHKGAEHVTRFNNSPAVFSKYLRIAKDYADARRDSQPPFVMINAWNEWVEGSYLLPDEVNGFGYLEAVRNVFLSRVEKTPLFQEGCAPSPLKASLLEVGKNRVEVTTTSVEGGFALDGQWDLRPYAKLRFTAHNDNPDDYLSLYVFLENANPDTKSRPTSGIMEDRFKIAPGATETIEVDLPCDIPHPEVNRALTLMRSTPYGEFRHIKYGVDLSDVRLVRFSSRKQYPGSHWSIENPQWIPGKRPIPDYMQLDSASFFPMIDRYGQFKHRDWPGKTHSDEDLEKARKVEERDLEAHPGPSGWNRYGGWADGPRYEATGHFRVQKIDGKWWMIDPEGCLYWSHGIVRVNASSSVTPLHGKKLASRNYMFEYLPAQGDSLYRFRFTNDQLLIPYYERWQEDSTFDFSSANIYRKYGPGYKEIWADLAHRRLRSWGLNTVANSSDIDICRMDRTPFIDRFDIRSVPIEGADGPYFPIMDPFDPSFRSAVEAELIAHKRDIEDPYLLGYFVDNEIKWGNKTHAAKCVAAAPEHQAAKKAMREWLKKRHGKAVEPSEASEEDLLDFNREIIEQYYRVIRESFDRYAPGVLYMGCRFASFVASNPDAVTIGARYCDVISHNQYRYTIGSYHLPDSLDKPVMIGEWHLGALDRGMFHPSLEVCDSQEERAHFYKEYVRTALGNPLIIGIHWHQFMDQATTGRFDGENFQVGFLDCCDTPYPETIAACREVGYDLYRTRFGK